MGGRGRPKWEAMGVQGGRPWEAKVGGQSGRPKWEAEVGGRSGRLRWEAKVGGQGGRQRWEAKVGGRARPKWEAVGVQGGRPCERPK